MADEFVYSGGYPNPAHLMSIADKLDYKVYYWREMLRSKQEKDKNKYKYKKVDFIIDSGGELMAIEVNCGRRGMNVGLPALAKAFKPMLSFVGVTGGVSLEDFRASEVSTIL